MTSTNGYLLFKDGYLKLIKLMHNMSLEDRIVYNQRFDQRKKEINEELKNNLYPVLKLDEEVIIYVDDDILVKEEIVIEKKSAIDQDIRELVSVFNQLPFIYTMFSCSGHLHTNEDPDYRNIPEGKCIYKTGNLIFILRIDEKTYEFIKDFDKVISNYDGTFVDVQLRPIGNFALMFNTFSNCRHISLEQGLKEQEHDKNLMDDLYLLASIYQNNGTTS